jgi:hypothetical protein
VNDVVLAAWLTPNEATILGATLGAVLGAALGGIVSLWTARYTLKHGANYGKQIADIHKTLDALARTQDELRQQQAQALEVENQRHVEATCKAEAARWKPIARIISKIEGSEQVNALSLGSTLEFAITEASLVSPVGVKLHAYSVLGAKAFSRGFSIPLTHSSLLLIANNNQQYFQTQTFEGSVTYTVLRKQDGTEYSGEVPFHGQATIVGHTGWFKLTG